MQITRHAGGAFGISKVTSPNESSHSTVQILSFSLCKQRLLDSLHLLRSGNGHSSDSSCGEKSTRMVQEAREFIRRCVGASPEDALIFCGSGATAAVKRLQEVMGIAVPANLRSRVIENLREEERWVVFVGPFEHHSNLLSWRQSIAEVFEIRIDADGMLDMEALELQLASMKYSNRPMLGSFSACSNVTGIITDTRAVSRLLHKYGAACFDFATSGPYVEIDMRSGEEEGYDAIFLSSHKFPGGPGAPGILVMQKALYQLSFSPPSTCGGGVVAYVNGFNAEMKYERLTKLAMYT